MRPCAAEPREPCQAGNRAALSGLPRVPQQAASPWFDALLCPNATNAEPEVNTVYLALYRKWRPSVFEDVVSQPHITETLQNQLREEKTAHAYLFTGSRGTGKTSCARIFAKAINCAAPRDGNPCLECAFCRSIEDGSATDVVEIDAASNNGVDDIRELRERAVFTPAECRYRVYIIDEVHMLSTNAFNALLKIMEEPPPHVKFILATTEVHKVPATILSRCQRFDFRRVRVNDMVERMLHIASVEGFTLEPDAAELIARLSDGAMRDALSLLDQCASAPAVTTEVVSAAAGVAGRDYLFRLADATAAHKPGDALALLDELYAASKDFRRLCDELTEHFRCLMLQKASSGKDFALACLPEELPRYAEQASRLGMGEILRALDVLRGCGDALSRAVNARLTLEMCLIRLCSPELDTGTEALLARIERLERSGPPAPATAQPLPQAPAPSATAVETPKSQVDQPPEAPPSVPHQEAKAFRPEELVPVAEWPEIMEDLAALAPAIKGVLGDSTAFSMDDTLFIDAPNSLFGALLKKDGNAKLLGECVRARLGRPYRIRLRKREAKKEEAPAVEGFLEAAKRLGADVNTK